MSNPNVEYLGVMAWAAQFQWIQDKIAPGDRVQIQCNANKIRVGDEVRQKRLIMFNNSILAESYVLYSEFQLNKNRSFNKSICYSYAHYDDKILLLS